MSLNTTEHASCTRQWREQSARDPVTDLEEIADESVADDGDGALPQAAAVQEVVRVEHAAHQGKADDTVEVEHNQPQHRNPQQGFACKHTAHRVLSSSAASSLVEGSTATANIDGSK